MLGVGVDIATDAVEPQPEWQRISIELHHVIGERE